MSWDDFFIDHFFVSVALITVVVVAFLACLGAVIAHATFPADVASIEQVRAAVAVVGIGENEDVLGQALYKNRLIVTRRLYNDMWWAGWAVPNGWDDVALIDLGRTE